MKSYQALADFYDQFSLGDCDYDRWKDFILDVAKSHSVHSVVDLACGTGKMTKLLQSAGLDVIGIDSSAEMLSQAATKCRCKLVLQDICSFRLPRPAQMAVCVNDGINYLSPKRVTEFFKTVRANLQVGAPFVFDFSTPHKLKDVLAGNVFYVDQDDATLLWTNKGTQDGVRMELTIFRRDGQGTYTRQDEVHVQYAHSHTILQQQLSQCGFRILSVSADYGLPLSDDALRHTIVALAAF